MHIVICAIQGPGRGHAHAPTRRSGAGLRSGGLTCGASGCRTNKEITVNYYGASARVYALHECVEPDGLPKPRCPGPHRFGYSAFARPGAFACGDDDNTKGMPPVPGIAAGAGVAPPGLPAAPGPGPPVPPPPPPPKSFTWITRGPGLPPCAALWRTTYAHATSLAAYPSSGCSTHSMPHSSSASAARASTLIRCSGRSQNSENAMRSVSAAGPKGKKPTCGAGRGAVGGCALGSVTLWGRGPCHHCLAPCLPRLHCLSLRLVAKATKPFGRPAAPRAVTDSGSPAAHQLVYAVALAAKRVLAQVPRVLAVYARPYVVELPKHRVLSNVDDHLPPKDARALDECGGGGHPAATV
jgi:hypothetical protein